MEVNNITDDKLQHIIGVARECYRLAKIEGLSEEECRKMWLIGYLHDIGYEFVGNKSKHGETGSQMLQMIGVDDDICIAIANHGQPISYGYFELDILNVADATIDSLGRKVTPEQRLEDIESRYGIDSDEYESMKLLIGKLRKRHLL